MRGAPPAIWISSRGIAVMLALAIVCAVASVVPVLIAVAIACAALFVACVVADASLGPSARSLRIVRREIGTLALGRSADLVYDVTNTTSRSVRVGLFEAPPEIVAFGATQTCVDVGPRQTATARATIVPTERGRAHFGRVYAWCESTLGLVRRRYRIDAAQDVRVMPDLAGVEQSGTLAKRATLVEIGLRKLRRRGVGTEFESLRDYQSGDGFRLVDWKATARRGRMTVAQYEVERSQNVVVALDCGRLMTPRLGKARKLDYALTAALSVMKIAQLADDNIGLLAFAAKPILQIAPRRGAAHYGAIARTAYDLQPRLEEPDYETVFTDLRRAHGKRSLVILFTDIFDPVTSAAVLAGIGTLVKRHLVVCVLMNDAAVEDALAAVPTTPQAAYRTSIAMTLSDERAKTIATLRAAGVIALDVPANAMSVRLIDAYLDVKRRGLL